MKLHGIKAQCLEVREKAIRIYVPSQDMKVWIPKKWVKGGDDPKEMDEGDEIFVAIPQHFARSSGILPKRWDRLDE